VLLVDHQNAVLDREFVVARRSRIVPALSRESPQRSAAPAHFEQPLIRIRTDVHDRGAATLDLADLPERNPIRESTQVVALRDEPFEGGARGARKNEEHAGGHDQDSAEQHGREYCETSRKRTQAAPYHGAAQLRRAPDFTARKRSDGEQQEQRQISEKAEA